MKDKKKKIKRVFRILVRIVAVLWLFAYFGVFIYNQIITDKYIEIQQKKILANNFDILIEQLRRKDIYLKKRIKTRITFSIIEVENFIEQARRVSNISFSSIKYNIQSTRSRFRETMFSISFRSKFISLVRFLSIIEGYNNRLGFSYFPMRVSYIRIVGAGNGNVWVSMNINVYSKKEG